MGAIRYMINAMDLQLECARILRDTLLIPVLMYSSETMIVMAFCVVRSYGENR